MIKIPKKEEEILAFWQEHGIFKKTLEKDSPEGEFVFYEGPPTANGKPGLHHMLARVFKDVIARYKTMRGYHVTRKAGWDTHGLPVEIQVEKELGISGKPDIEKYGIEKFNKKAQESVWTYQQDWEKFTERIGYWIDMDDPYITYKPEYIETVWWILKQVWDKGLLYKGHKVVPHCPRCGTSLSSHEVAQGYKLVKEPSIYAKFKVTEGKGDVQPGDYILAWTTTPWTLPGNVALAVGSDITYVRLEKNGEHLILAKDLVESVVKDGYTVTSEFPGSSFIETVYEPLFPGALDPGDKKAWYVAPADFVTTEDGTGVVHTAVMYGVDDYELGMKLELPAVHTVDENGNFTDSVSKWAGKFVKDTGVEQGIVDDLKDRGLLFSVVAYEHDYPFCWRCDTPLLYYAKDSWFIKMTDRKDELLKNAEDINWYPAHIKKGRFGEWLENVKDWAISRERYWGTPLPIWKCETCDKHRCIGSREELGSQLEDLHRPYIDDVVLACDCGGEMKRIPEVLDTWFDSGSMPFAQYHYPFEEKERIDSGAAYPAEYISEAIDQTRGWFYTLLAVSTLLDKGTSYNNVICLGHINDKHGKKMSKSKGNIVDPWEMIEKYGVDSLRYHMYAINQPGEYKNFDEKNVYDVQRKVVTILLNSLAFYNLFAREDDNMSIASEHVMDRWVISYLHKTIESITSNLDSYDVMSATRTIGDLIQEISTWYIRRSRDRFKDEEMRAGAVSTLNYVLKTSAQLMAPFMPFIAEHLWKELGSPDYESVHLAPWPEYSREMNDTEVLRIMDSARGYVEKAHALRAKAGIKVRQPLSKLEITEELGPEFLDIIADEVNVKKVVVQKELSHGSNDLIDDEKTISLHTELTDELKIEGAVRELVRATNALRKKKGLKPGEQSDVRYATASDFLRESVIEKHAEALSDQTSGSLWLSAADASGEYSQSLDIFGERISISL